MPEIPFLLRKPLQSTKRIILRQILLPGQWKGFQFYLIASEPPAKGALDQLDELLRPWYERETKAGSVTDDEVVWYIASLFFNDTHYSQLAGPTPDGSRDTASRMSYLILEAMHVLGIPSNIALRVHDGVDEALLRLVHQVAENIRGTVLD